MFALKRFLKFLVYLTSTQRELLDLYFDNAHVSLLYVDLPKKKSILNENED
jgi:hypothetical protein